MSVLKDRERTQIQKVLADCTQPVTLTMFTQEIECQYCGLTREILEELAVLSDMVQLEVFDFVEQASLAQRFKVDKIPALIVRGEQDPGIRFYGVPSGYGFATLLETIRDVGGRGPELPEPVQALLAQVRQPVHLQVMITPT